MSKAKHFKKIIMALVLTLLITSGFRCKFITPQQKELLKPISINWWGVYDDAENFSEVIQDYKVQHPNINIHYRKLRPEEFERELLEALAEDRGPDIISLHNTWINRYLDKLEPLPPTTKMAYQVVKKSLNIKQEVLIEIRETQSITAGQLKNAFIDVVGKDVIIDNKIYGLPLSVDTLVLLYNQDLFNNAGLPLPPKTWAEVQDFVKRLTFQDNQGNLVQSGITLGTAKNNDYNFDVLSLLMMQNGAQMITNRSATFHVTPPGGEKSYNPGPEALRFYTDFAMQSREVFTWDNSMAKALDAFIQGKVAMTFGYTTDLEYIEARRQGKLNYNIAKIPQIEGRPEVNYASYWIQTVSKKSQYINEAWDFIQFVSQKPQAKKYLDKTSKPTALRSLIEDQLTNDEVGVFAQQLLTSDSWYRGKDVGAAKNAFAEMIESAISEEVGFEAAADIAARKVQQTL